MEQEIQQVKIIKNPSSMSSQIVDFILFKNRVTKAATNIDNKLFLCGIHFWLAQQKETGEAYLMYDQHPNNWDTKALKDAMDEIAHQLYVSTGVIAP